MAQCYGSSSSIPHGTPGVPPSLLPAQADPKTLIPCACDLLERIPLYFAAIRMSMSSPEWAPFNSGLFFRVGAGREVRTVFVKVGGRWDGGRRREWGRCWGGRVRGWAVGDNKIEEEKVGYWSLGSE